MEVILQVTIALSAIAGIIASWDSVKGHARRVFVALSALGIAAALIVAIQTWMSAREEQAQRDRVFATQMRQFTRLLTPVEEMRASGVVHVKGRATEAFVEILKRGYPQGALPSPTSLPINSKRAAEIFDSYGLGPDGGRPDPVPVGRNLCNFLNEFDLILTFRPDDKSSSGCITIAFQGAEILGWDMTTDAIVVDVNDRPCRITNRSCFAPSALDLQGWKWSVEQPLSVEVGVSELQLSVRGGSSKLASIWDNPLVPLKGGAVSQDFFEDIVAPAPFRAQLHPVENSP